jgi:DNA adenine methylase
MCPAMRGHAAGAVAGRAGKGRCFKRYLPVWPQSLFSLVPDMLDSIAIFGDTIRMEVLMSYPGGKAADGVYHQIINQIPPHRVYIEPFLGGGAVLLRKRAAHVTIGIDSDTSVVARWQAGLMGSLLGSTYINDDAISFLKSYDWQGDEFVYADPPYLFDVRSCKRPIYACEFGTMEQHERLLRVLLGLPCKVAISGYQSSLYSSMLATWRAISYNAKTRGGGVRREWLWMNYPAPVELHDYRYLGSNFRERERLKRIRVRWLARLDRMDDLERYALLSSIAEYNDRIPRT